MAVYVKHNDEWAEVKTPYVKRNGVWVPAYEAHAKQSGSWQMAYEHDTTPSSPPELSLMVAQDRYIRVGVRLPGWHDTDVKRIRVLASRTAPPTTQFGEGFIHEEDETWKGEPWSDWYYNDSMPTNRGQAHPDTSVFNYKQYPPNPGPNLRLPGGKNYYFAAWSEDKNGNWSHGTYHRIWMPKEGNEANRIILKEARFMANASGSAGANGHGYVEGDLIARDNPRSNGFLFYGGKISSAIGEHGTPTVRSARIRLTRLQDDPGQPTANVRVFWHGKPNSGELPLADGNQQDVKVIGTINKGETKWFDLPNSYFSDLNDNIKGLGLAYGIQASDALQVAGLSRDLRCGELNVVWEEAR